ncbi:MAG: hypothetical protein AAF846_14060 [Chloroflexota bacterium]
MKQKRKHDSVLFPSIYWHMILLNGLMGILLVIGVRVFFSLDFDTVPITTLLSESAFFGTLLGNFIGLAQAYFMKPYVNTLPEQFTHDDIDNISLQILGVALGTPIALAVFSFCVLLIYGALMIIPALIMSLLSTFSAYLYLRRLHHYSNVMYPQKRKVSDNHDISYLEDAIIHETQNYESDDKRNSTHLVQG